MKQKAVFKVALEDEKKRSKALKVVVGFPGVTKAEVQGYDKGKLAVEGDDLDITSLTTSLRKKLGGIGSVHLITFQAAGKEKYKEDMVKTEQQLYGAPGYLAVHPQPVYWPPQYAMPAQTYYSQTQVHADPNYDDTPGCRIM